jgi:TolB-like protein
MSQRYRFDRVEVVPAERSLLIDGVPAELGSRAFDVLYTLIKNRERVVTKNELLDLVWPGLVVEENNLQAQVSALRKLLGHRAISTIPGRGYQFCLAETPLPPEMPQSAVLDALPSQADPKPNFGAQFAPMHDRRRTVVTDNSFAQANIEANAELAAVMDAMGAAGRLQRPAANHVHALSIAVLPFANLTGNPNDEYFSDGLADQLLQVLAKIEGLRVAARTSAFSFKGKPTTVTEIGQQLNVATLLEGSVRKNGNRVRISVQLIKAADGFQLWSESYDRTLDDIFALQDEIAQFVLAALRAKLLSATPSEIEMRSVAAEVAAAAKGRSNNVEAHRLYLYARFLLNRNADTDVTKSIDYLRQALAIDRECALLWATLSNALSVAADFALIPIEAGVAEAFKTAQHAVLLDSSLSEAHVAMAIHQTQAAQNWSGAAMSIQHAIHLSPTNVDALNEAAQLYYALGQLPQALQYAELSVALDPLNLNCHRNLALVFNALDRLAESERAFRRALELSPTAPIIHANLALTLERQGRHAEAIDEANRELVDFSRLRTLGVLHFRGGDFADADLALNALVESLGGDGGFNIATNFAVRGDANLVFHWLERAYIRHDSGLAYLKANWMFRPLHSDPRWPAFLKKVGLSD